ncbi:hypothetical protein [Gorillibacterium sp. sgz5001074]|uniref:hypothetical protein n=1 Tax=Gorillibacterium sp. sgz5001074 TaxID=3446695 RepID=UPI003F67E218
MNPERLIYTFVSYASHYDTDWAKGTPMEGVDRTARIAHKHGIPVTWIVNGGSVPVLADRIREWHDAYGDDVILQTPFFIEDCGASKIKFKEALERDWQSIREAFPWARTKIAARGKIYNEVIEALEELDFQGMWGYCWEQVWWDGISHRGIPWGSWYVDGSRYKAPHPGKGQVVACEWTARDLNLSFHAGSPVLYSTDPNDVLRAGLCTGENIEYWKRMFDVYLENTAHNGQVFFLQQQEAHEMEYTDRFRVFPASHVDECEGMLDRFFEYVSGSGAMLTTLPQAVELYHEAYPAVTAPAYMLTRDTGIRPEINAYTMTLGGTGAGPWPDTFFYYDRDCQMVFVDGENKPRQLRSYVGKGDMNEEFLEPVPAVYVTRYEKSPERIQVVYEIGHWTPGPFGLAYWDDLSGYELESCEGAGEVKRIGDRLMFMRFDLTGGRTKVTLTLRGTQSAE